jgi:hypothetical protein
MARVRTTVDYWGEGRTLDWAASLRHDDQYRMAVGALERAAVGPKMALMTLEANSLKSTSKTSCIASGCPRWSCIARTRPSQSNLRVDHFPSVGDFTSITDEVEEFLTGQRHEHPPDRLLATVLFTDIVDSTRRAAERGDRPRRELLERHDELTRAEVRRFQGRLVKHTGDGFLATFDGPNTGRSMRHHTRRANAEIGD